jgi:hypothetical protein
MENLALGKYRHYKGKHCEVLGVALHSETQEPLVVYRNCEDSEATKTEQLRARPYDLFVETIEIDGKKVPRFEYVG